MKQNKPTYTAPKAETFVVQTEGCILGLSDPAMQMILLNDVSRETYGAEINLDE